MKTFFKLKKIYFFILDRELTLSAASLSFYTIFTIIPLLLIFTTVLTSMKSFEPVYFEIQNMILSNFLPVNHEIIMRYINDFLEHSLKISGVSFFILFISSLLFFQNYEYVANKIFKVKQRGFIQSVWVYILMITLTPMALGLAFSISAYLANIMAKSDLTSHIDFLSFIPYIIIWVLFFVLFKFSANEKVSIKAALRSSLIISFIFSMAKNIFIYYVFLNQIYTTLYGSFSILLFLFLWTYASWFIFLHGLRLCYYMNKHEKQSILNE